MNNFDVMRMIRFLVCLLAFLFMGGMEPAFSDPVKPPVQRREIPAGKIDQYRGQRAFQYNEPSAKFGRGFWMGVRDWLLEKLDRLLSGRGVSVVLNVLKWLLPSLILGFAILKIAGMEQISLWRRGTKGEDPDDPHHEDIHVMDFEGSIAKAVAMSRFREAVRLQYLFTLKLLTDRGYIRWQPGKTNGDYASEISGTALQQGFASLTHIFECAWYGELPVNGDAYTQIEPGFRGFRERIRA
jgi:Domain of unknown function (DUF4129)